MELSVYKYKKEHPFIFKFIKIWIRIGLPVFRSLKHTISNDIHTEMIMRLMGAIGENNNLTLDDALKIHFEFGKELGIQLKELLSIDENNAASISKAMDFLHSIMNVKGKNDLGSSNKISISIWSVCPLHNKLQQSKGGVQLYCNSQQEIYKGVISKINPKAKSKQIVRSESCTHCEIKTWITN